MDVTHRFDRWMFRGGRPHRAARIMNRSWARRAPLEQFEPIAAHIPVFHIEPAVGAVTPEHP